MLEHDTVSRTQGQPMHLKSFIRKLPKAEMHLHLEGTVAWEKVRTVDDDTLPDHPHWQQSDYRFDDFEIFSVVMQRAVNYLYQSEQAYHEVAAAYFEQLVAQNVRYVEVSIGVGLVHRTHLNFAKVVDGILAAAPDGLHVRVIGGLNRRFPHPIAGDEAQAALTTAGITGIDLHSDERVGQLADFVDVYDAARERGLLLRAHAGELMPASSVTATLDQLGVTRIEHGTTAISDPQLMKHLREQSITLDMCPTSNVKLRVVDDYASHPIGALLRQGVRVTCSTDDPAVFGVSLSDELRLLAAHQNFSAAELAQLQINAFQAAVLPHNIRQTLIDEVRTLLAQFEASSA